MYIFVCITVNKCTVCVHGYTYIVLRHINQKRDVLCFVLFSIFYVFLCIHYSPFIIRQCVWVGRVGLGGTGFLV